MLLSTALYLILLLHSATASGANIEDEIIRNVMKEIGSKFEQIEKKLDSFLEMSARNDTDELEERVQILELEMDNVENNIEILINQDSIHEVRITDIEDDVLNNQINIEALSANVTDLYIADSALEERIAYLEDAISAPWIACESSPCDNGATCVDVNVDTFICLCRDGFFGLTCSNSYGETAFLATIDADTITPAPDAPIVFNATYYNPGGHYDNTTGIYTVPFDGLYHITVNIKSDSDTDFGFYIVVDDSVIAHTHNADIGGPGILSAIISISLPLQVGQEVWVRPWALTSLYGTFSHMHSWFGGYLINAN